MLRILQHTKLDTHNDSSSQRPQPAQRKETQEKNFNNLSGIRTGNSYNRASADLHVRPYGRWNRPMLLLTVGNYEVNCLGGFIRHNQHSNCAIWPAESNLQWTIWCSTVASSNYFFSFQGRKINRWTRKNGNVGKWVVVERILTYCEIHITSLIYTVDNVQLYPRE